MRKRKERRETSETLISVAEEGIDEIRKREKEFFACYLLASLSPRHKGHSYIGFTVNPLRRIRQHNGELSSGAWRTKNKRPWEMVLCIYGFPTNVSALQFEWAWQHPTESLAVRKAAASLKSVSGIARKVKLAYTMLTLPAWQSLNLTVNFFSTKYTKHSAGCPSLPEHMKIQVCPMNELPCYTGSDQTINDGEDDWNGDCESRTGNGSLQDNSSNVAVYNYRAEYRCNMEVTTHEHLGYIGDSDLRSTKDQPPSKEEDHGTLFCAINSPTKSSSSSWKNFFSAAEMVEDCTHEHLGYIGDSDLRSTKDQPPSKEEDHGTLFCVFNSPTKSSSSSWKNFFSAAEMVEDCELFASVDEINNKLDCSTKQQFPNTAAAHTDQSLSSRHLLFSPEGQVMNLVTPSPDCIVNSSTKTKKRAIFVCPEIIDLTKSPLFIQL